MTEQTCLQLIDENKAFSSDIPQFLEDQGIDKNGLKYHLVSVFGSQSTGKSTLLNALFQTSFNVMDETSRQQTTKGIWLAKSNLASQVSDETSESDDSADSYLHVSTEQKGKSDIMVMDVEGTDGRERGEDQDFERKSALFALATSEILIVNMWENQVGLYQGANMGLLRTVFEVNLTLFHASRQTPRSLILFVIRDHIGTTPLENLSQTLLGDLKRAWDSISKPESLAESKIEDFFDIRFEALPHKILMPEKFETQIDVIAKKFQNDYFKPEYHRQVPIDGWNMYAANIWEQIEQNKDLDLPTQQILVARFRCSEIAAQAMDMFDQALRNVDVVLGDSESVVPEFGATFKGIRTEALTYFDSMASRYVSKVYQGQRLDLLNQIDSKLFSLFTAQMTAVHKQCLRQFEQAELPSTKEFANAVKNSKEQAVARFEELAQEAASIDSTVFVYTKEAEQFHRDLNKIENDKKQAHIDRIANKSNKKIAQIFDEELDSYFGAPNDQTWDQVMKFFKSTVDLILDPYRNDEGSIDFGVGANSKINQTGVDHVKKQAWLSFDAKLKQITMTSNVLAILKDLFDNKFRYDKNGVPIVWTAMDDIETPFSDAKDEALRALPILSTATTQEGEPIRPDVEIDDDEDDDAESLQHFATRLTTTKRTEISDKFKRQADASFIDAKRSTTQSATQIPWYMFVLLVVLGWNEFMAVLRNPFLFVFVLLAAGGAWVIYTLGMAPHVISVSSAMYNRATDIAKEKLREVLEVPPQQQPHSRPSEEIEMDDLKKTN